MMLFAWLLLAAAPKAPVEAEVVTWVPRLDAIGTVLPFFSAAGASSVMLRPASWREQAFPFLEVDMTSRESLEAAGIDPGGSLTNSRVLDRTLSCVQLSNLETFSKRVDEKLQRLGTPFTTTSGSVSIKASRDPIRTLAGVAIVGREACALTGSGLSVEGQLPLLAKALTKPTNAALALPGVAVFATKRSEGSSTIALNAKDLTLVVDAKTSLPVASLAGAGASPYASLHADGVLDLRVRLTKASMPDVVSQVVNRLPHGHELATFSKPIAATLTGNAALVISHVKVTQGLRTPAARFFAVKGALLAETNAPETVKAVLETVDPKLLSSPEGAIDVALVGTTLVVSNDPEAKRVALVALDAKGSAKQAHGAEFTVGPTRLAKALASVPLLEAVQTPELAAVVAASTELGPLLLSTESVTGWLDGAAGQHRAQGTFRLAAPRSPPDGGL